MTSETRSGGGKDNHIDFDDSLYIHLSDNAITYIITKSYLEIKIIDYDVVLC